MMAYLIAGELVALLMLWMAERADYQWNSGPPISAYITIAVIVLIWPMAVVTITIAFIRRVRQ